MFTLGRQMCNESARIASAPRLISATESAYVRSFYLKCIANLRKEDRALNQVQEVLNLLVTGVGVHHAGLLPLLKEINFGEFEMKSYAEMKDDPVYQEWISDKSGTLPPPGGESIQQFTSRIREGFEDLKKRHALKILSMRHSGMEAWSVVVCHGGPVSAVLETLFPGEKDNFYQWIPDPGHGYILRMEDLDVVSAEKF